MNVWFHQALLPAIRMLRLRKSRKIYVTWETTAASICIENKNVYSLLESRKQAHMYGWRMELHSQTANRPVIRRELPKGMWTCAYTWLYYWKADLSRNSSLWSHGGSVVSGLVGRWYGVDTRCINRVTRQFNLRMSSSDELPSSFISACLLYLIFSPVWLTGMNRCH